MFRATILPTVSYENHLVQHDLVYTVADVVYRADPRHLAEAFQFFGNALLFGKLFHQLKTYLIRLLINALQIGNEFSVHPHDIDGSRTVFLQGLIMPLPPDSYAF